MLIDTHSHIYGEEFDADRDDVVQRALSAGVELILLPAIDKESYARQAELAQQYPTLFRQMMGLHPTSVGPDFRQDLQLVHDRLFATPEAYVGVGEIGLDLYWDTTYRTQQEEALECQIEWAEALDKPIVLHVRNAYQEVFDLLQRHGSPRYRGIMHCFSGTVEEAQRAVEMGFVLGVGGVVTYKKSLLPEVVAAVGLQHIVLETDAPYLAPVPHRGKRNESAFVLLVAQRVAEIVGCSVESVAAQTSATAQRVFGL